MRGAGGLGPAGGAGRPGAGPHGGRRGGAGGRGGGRGAAARGWPTRTAPRLLSFARVRAARSSCGSGSARSSAFARARATGRRVGPSAASARWRDRAGRPGRAWRRRCWRRWPGPTGCWAARSRWSRACGPGPSKQALWERRAREPVSSGPTGHVRPRARAWRSTCRGWTVPAVLAVAAAAGLCQPLPDRDPVHFMVCRRRLRPRLAGARGRPGHPQLGPRRVP